MAGRQSTGYPTSGICGHCTANMPTNEECIKIINYIRNAYSSLPIGRIPEFTLYRIKAENWRGEQNSKGFAMNNNGSYSIKTHELLSKTPFAEVMAHEMLHLWVYERHLQLEPAILEGFCNLGSYEILTRIDTAIAKNKIENIINNPDSIYGAGFRRVKSEYDIHGWSGVVSRIKNSWS